MIDPRLHHWCDYLLGRWQNAAGEDFLVLAGLIVLIGWIARRLAAD